jgi:hypothetical protein
MTDEELDEILDLMRSYFEAERVLQEQVATCERESDLFARQRHALLIEARERLRGRLQALIEKS